MLLKKRSSPPVFSKSLFLPGCRTQKQRNRLAISLFVCSTQKEPGKTGSSQKPPNSSVHYFILYLGLPQASYSSRFEISPSPKIHPVLWKDQFCPHRPQHSHGLFCSDPRLRETAPHHYTPPSDASAFKEAREAEEALASSASGISLDLKWKTRPLCCLRCGMTRTAANTKSWTQAWVQYIQPCGKT